MAVLARNIALIMVYTLQTENVFQVDFHGIDIVGNLNATSGNIYTEIY